MFVWAAKVTRFASGYPHMLSSGRILLCKTITPFTWTAQASEYAPLYFAAVLCCCCALQVQPGQYGRSTAMKLHSAMQQHLNACCRAAGTSTIQLNQAAPYDALYKMYCSKKRDQALVKQLGAGSSACLYAGFGRDAYARGVHMRLASADPDDAMELSLVTAQVSMVARGHDLRARQAASLGIRLLTCIGKTAYQIS